VLTGILLSTTGRTTCAPLPSRPLSSAYAAGGGHSDEVAISDAVPGSCTIFTASYGNTVLFGNNEDWNNPKAYYWVSPSSEGDYGVVYFGYDNLFPQGGINEKGLAFDANALPGTALNPHPELPNPPDAIVNKVVLKKCATVREAIDMAKSYNWNSGWGESVSGQWFLADSTGDAVVISVGPDGKLAFTRKPEGDGYLVSTNFNRANPKNRFGRYPCWRYDTATAMLEKIEDIDDLTVDYFRSILDAVCQKGASINTLYSNIFDLRNGVIYLYYWHQFNEVVTLNVAEELAKTPSPTGLRDLFSQETVKRASTEHLAYRIWKVARGWLFLVG